MALLVASGSALGWLRQCSQTPRRTQGPSQLAVGLGIVDEQFPGRVPAQLAAETKGAPRELADNVGARSHVDVTDGLLPAADVLDIGTNFHPAFDMFTRICNEIVLITEPQPITINRTRQLVDELKKRSFGSGRALTIVAVNRTHTEISLSVSKMEEMLKSSLALGIPPATELAYLASTRNAPMVLLQPQGIIAQQLDILVKQIAGHASA